MRELISTLTQSGLLAVLLQRQRYKVIQLARRRADRKQMRAAFWSTLTWPWHALTAPALVDDSAEPIVRAPRRHTFLRLAPFETAVHFDANGIQRVYRCYSSRPRTGDWKVKTYGICFTASFLLLVLSGHHLLRRLGSRSYAR